jgi:hypothetical protein
MTFWNRSDPIFDPRRTALAGLPRASLVTALANAQAAYMELMTGVGLVVSTSYDGKSVTYYQTDVARLESFILLLQRMLGINPGRRALRPYFR